MRELHRISHPPSLVPYIGRVLIFFIEGHLLSGASLSPTYEIELNKGTASAPGWIESSKHPDSSLIL
jgi:hypothetical protein